MKEKLKELFKNKKFIFGIVIWVVVAIYLVSCIIFTAKNVYAYDMVDTGLWTTDRRELTLSNGDIVNIYQSDLMKDKEYLVIAYNSTTSAYDFFYSASKKIGKYSDNYKSNYIKFGIKDLVYEYVPDTQKYNGYYSASKLVYLNGNNYEIVFSNYDLVDESGATFFMGAPTVPTITQTGLTGAEIAEKATAVIGLLIPLLVLSVIGFLAFRKGWKFLVTNLKQA